jgi:hypothetical protein
MRPPESSLLRRSICASCAIAASLFVLAPAATAATPPLCNGLPATIYPGSGYPGTATVPISVVGTPGPDVIVGSVGNDTIDGAGGDDTICARDGNDTVRGSGGFDTIQGGMGNDSVGGGAGNDTVIGGSGDDNVRGGIGNDFVGGGHGNDLVQGGEGDDTVAGGPEDDYLIGGTGTDRCFGDGGTDKSSRCEDNTNVETVLAVSLLSGDLAAEDAVPAWIDNETSSAATQENPAVLIPGADATGVVLTPEEAVAQGEELPGYSTP